jgi:hypothetical protein
MRRSSPGRIGAWRLLDIVLATMPFRMSLMGGMSALPEYGPADVKARFGDPCDELPDSNISDGEQQQAMHRERTRRWLEARG